jgi:stress-induced-phosphoprotein 1
MSADPRGTEAKAKASNAWSEGKYDKAVEYFSEAITFGGDNELLKVLHSNRSAAYLKLNKMEESLKDANKCVDLDSKWGKGYTRKGDALLANKKFSEAYNAYNSALQFAPSDLMLTKKCEQAMRGIRNSTSPSPSGSSAPTTMPTGFVYFLKVLVLVLCATYILPLGRTVSVTCYK